MAWKFLAYQECLNSWLSIVTTAKTSIWSRLSLAAFCKNISLCITKYYIASVFCCLNLSYTDHADLENRHEIAAFVEED
jgi:hypothetical protein